MKRFLLASAGLAALIAGPAVAADMPVAAPLPPVAYYDWSGAYVGFNVGGVWYKDNVHVPTPGAAGLGIAGVNPDFSVSGSDGIYGFHAGAQWQWGAWVPGRRGGAQRMHAGMQQQQRRASGGVLRRQHLLPDQDD